MSKNDGGPAFPCTALQPFSGGTVSRSETGISMRDYFAAAALQGVISRSDYRMFPHDGDDLNDDHVAELAYKIADAMLRAREES